MFVKVNQERKMLLSWEVGKQLEDSNTRSYFLRYVVGSKQ
jgi:hypothetical protein